MTESIRKPGNGAHFSTYSFSQASSGIKWRTASDSPFPDKFPSLIYSTGVTVTAILKGCICLERLKGCQLCTGTTGSFQDIPRLMSQLKHHGGDIYKTWKSLVNSVVYQQSCHLLFNSMAILITALPRLPKTDLFQVLTGKKFPLTQEKNFSK